MNAALANWVAGSLAVLGTVLLQYGVQTTLVQRILRRSRKHRERRGWEGPLLHDVAMVFALIFGHLAQVFVWAIAYRALGELTSIGDAVYYSLTSYTTLGAVGLDLSAAHRMLGAVEAVVGVLMFGWSTALLVALVAVNREAEPVAPVEVSGAGAGGPPARRSRP